MLSFRTRKLFITTTAAVALAMGLASAPTLAGSYTGTFTITSFYVASPGNYQYRIFGMGNVPSCTNSPNWAYLEDTDGGSKAYVAAILSAFYAGKSVSLYLTPVNGFCHIGEVVVNQ